MPRKTKVEVEPEKETEPEGAPEEVEEIQEVKETVEEEKNQKSKRILSQRQLESLTRAREAAVLKKKELKPL